MIEAAIRKRFAAGEESGAFELDVAFRAAAGVTVLFGPSGSGKTLTLDSIAGFVRPDAGRIVLDGEALFDSEAGVNLPPQRRRCGYVFQNYALFPHMTLRENLEFAASRLPKKERRGRVEAMLETFRLAELAGRRPHEVSGGQQQRCSIARTLLAGPRLLLLDEPARGLDAPLKEELYAVLRQVREEFGTPILLVTHDLEECFALGEEMLVYNGGRIVQRGAPAAVLEEPATPEVARLLGRLQVLEAEGAGGGKLRLAGHEVAHDGTGLPAGEKATVYVRPDRLRAVPAGAAQADAGGLRAELDRVVEGPRVVRLEFRCGLRVEMPAGEYRRHGDNREWVIRFPEGSIGIFRRGRGR